MGETGNPTGRPVICRWHRLNVPIVIPWRDGDKAHMQSRLTHIRILFIAKQDRLLMQIAATEYDEVRL
jgi:hypothetical protein